jgi:hypothetical protein
MCTVHRPYRLAVRGILGCTLLASGSVGWALEFGDNDLKLTFGLYAQTRLDAGSGSDASGDPYAPSEASASGRADSADLYVRRFRWYMKGTYQGYLFNATVDGDNWGKNLGGGKDKSGIGLFEYYAGKQWQVGDTSHTLTVGKQVSWFNSANLRTSTMLLPTTRASVSYLAPVGVGLGYRGDAGCMRLFADIQNNTGDDNANATKFQGEGLVYLARLEVTGTGSWTSKWQESFAGKPGHGFVVGLESGINVHDRVSGAVADTSALGAEVLLHLDGLSALAEVRTLKLRTTTDAPATPNSSKDGLIYVLQAGYAVPLANGWVIEPATRLTSRDDDRANDAEGPLFTVANSATDYGNSGTQFEVGVNWYLSGHNHKIGLEWLHWTGEADASGAKARADLIRLQHQVLF